MSATKERQYIDEDENKDTVVQDLGDVLVTSEPLSPEEGRRILRKIDMK
jgi:hypothetical protein